MAYFLFDEGGYEGEDRTRELTPAEIRELENDPDVKKRRAKNSKKTELVEAFESLGMSAAEASIAAGV